MARRHPFAVLPLLAMLTGASLAGAAPAQAATTPEGTVAIAVTFSPDKGKLKNLCKMTVTLSGLPAGKTANANVSTSVAYPLGGGGTIETGVTGRVSRTGETAGVAHLGLDATNILRAGTIVGMDVSWAVYGTDVNIPVDDGTVAFYSSLDPQYFYDNTKSLTFADNC